MQAGQKISCEAACGFGSGSFHCRTGLPVWRFRDLYFRKRKAETDFHSADRSLPISVSTVCQIISGGTGTRLASDIPKQYIEVYGKPIISYCIESLSAHRQIDAIQIIADSAWQKPIQSWLPAYEPGKKFRGFSAPGSNRQLSILNGLEAIRKYADDSDYVFIHDAARPLLTPKQITACLDATKGHDGVIPVLPMKDTVYSSADGKRITALLDRSEIYAGQAPEVFRLGVYYAANVRLLPDRIKNINGSTEPAVMAGLDVAVIFGDENNFKITTKADLERFQSIVKEAQSL